MQPAIYPGPCGTEEFALAFDEGRAQRLLVIPALFDEANKLRRLTVEVMRRLDGSGLDCLLPDLPGTHESLTPLASQTLESWRDALAIAAEHFRATHVLTIRAGAVLAPPGLPGWRYAPTGGANALRSLLRARVISSREAGWDESTNSLTERGRTEGIELAGYQLGPQMFSELEAARLPDNGRQQDIAQGAIGGPGLWLRAEPDENPQQADALAAIIAMRAVQ